MHRINIKNIRHRKWLLSVFFMVSAIFAAKLVANKLVRLSAQEMKSLQAPNFVSKGIEVSSKSKKNYALTDFKGKWVVLEWFNNRCPFVEKHYGTGNMQSLQKKYTEKGVIWLTVASSEMGKQGHLDENTAKQVIEDRKSQQTAILLDASGDIARSFGATATPHMFIIDPNGNIVYQGAIDDKPAFRKSTLEGARNFVAEALDISLGIDAQNRKN
ncbi:MAG: redoxin domain-containing protein [Bdellovibrionota bacterium]